MAVLNILGRLIFGFVRGRAERQRLDEETGVDTSTARAYDTEADRPRRRVGSMGAVNASAIGSILMDAGTEVGRDGAGSVWARIKSHAEGIAEEVKDRLLIEAVILAAKADGELDAEERALILSHLPEDAHPDEVAFIEKEMARGTSLRRLTRNCPPDMDFRRRVYAVSLLAITVDTAAEVQHLRDLAEGLGLSADDVAKVTRAVEDGLETL